MTGKSCSPDALALGDADASSATLAKQLQQYLPGFTYNLTAEAPSIRAGICAQQTSYCSISGCANGGATVSTNFCNNQVRPRQRCDVAHSRADHGVRVPALTRPADIAAGTASARAECRDCSTGSRQ